MARKSLIQIRRDTAANWTSTNPVLAAGEPGYESDTGKTKYGDGTTAWTSLGYSGGTVPDATFSVKGKVYQAVYDVRDYGATGDGVTDDSAAIQAASDAAGANALWFDSNGNYKLAAQVLPTVDNQKWISRGARIFGSLTPVHDGGLIQIDGVDGLEFEGITFESNGGSPAVTSTGHDGLTFRYCNFTGTTTTTVGLFHTEGFFGTSSFNDTEFDHCKFYDATNILRSIHLYPRSGRTLNDTRIHDCEFRNVKGVAIFLDAYDRLTNTHVYNNRFIDLPWGGTTNSTGLALQAVIASEGYFIEDTVFEGNYYKNTITTAGHNQGVVYIYGSTRTVIRNNEMIGSWTQLQNTIGPAIAPGRTGRANVDFTATNNQIRGFDSPFDPDSLINAIISHNTIEYCKNGINLGYNLQENVKIENNLMRNSISTDYGGTGIIFANSYMRNCSFKFNTIVDDRGINPPVVTAALSTGTNAVLTVGTPVYYRVTAVDEIGQTLGSTEDTVTPTAGNQRVQLSWPIIIGARSYNIYRSTTSGTYGATSLVANVTQQNGNTISYTDTGVVLTAGTLPGASTVAPVVMTKAIELTGNYHQGDVEVVGNVFYMPNSTFSTYSLFTKEFGNEDTPTVVHDNKIKDSAVTLVDTYSIGNMTGTAAISIDNGRRQYGTLTGDVSLTFASGHIKGDEIKLVTYQDATGGRAIGWPTNVIWPGSTTPRLNTAASNRDMFTFTWDGTNWIGDQTTSSGDYVKKTGDSISGQLNVGAGYSVNFGNTASTAPSYLDAGNNTALHVGAGAFTLQAKIKLDPAWDTSQIRYIMSCSNQYLFWVDTARKVRGGVWGGGNPLSTTVLSLNTTYDVMFTFDGTNTSKIYVNGVLESTATGGTTASGTNNLFIGKRNGESLTAFMGPMDNVRIWNRLLSGAEITTVSGNGAAPTSGLKLELGFDNQSTLDTSPIANTVTATSITYVTGITDPLPNAGTSMNVWGDEKIFGNLNATSFTVPAIKNGLTTTASNLTLTIAHNTVVFTATATATLPAATGSGQTYRLICRTGTLTIDPNGAETVKGATTFTILAGEDIILTDTATGVWE